MPKLVILNVGIEHSMGRVLPQDWLARSTMRQAWFLEEGDVLVTPLPLDPVALEYIAATMGFQLGSVTVMICDALVTDDLLLQPDLVEEFRRAVGPNAQGWGLVSCFVTPGVAQLAEVLGIAPLGAFAAQRGADLLNHKSGFRQLVAGAGLPLVAGWVAESEQRLAWALDDLLAVTGVVIVKRDDGAGGDGNVTVTTQDKASFEGAFRTVRVGSTPLLRVAEGLWNDLVDRSSPRLVVEVYHPARHRFYVEFSVENPIGHPVLSHGGTIRPALPPDRPLAGLVGIGLDIPLQLPPHDLAAAVHACGQVAALAGRVGYRGVLNVDGITTEAGTVICNEVNARWGGGSVLHSIATRLLGPAYGNDSVLSSARALPALDLSRCLDGLRQTGLAFDLARREGVLLLTCDPARSATMECLLIARSRAREREFERRLFDMLEADA